MYSLYRHYIIMQCVTSLKFSCAIVERKIVEKHLTKCSKCNTCQVITDLLHEFMNLMQ